MLRQIKLQCQLETGRTACRVSLVNHPLLHQHVETKLHQRLLSCRYFRDSIWQPTKALPQILCDAERWSTLKSRTFGPAITMCNLLYEMNVCLILKKRISFWLHPSKCVLSVCLFCGMIFVVLVITLSICKYLLNSIIIFVRSSIVAVLQVTVWSALYYMSAAWYSAQPHSAAGPQPGPAQGRLNILWIPHIASSSCCCHWRAWACLWNDLQQQAAGCDCTSRHPSLSLELQPWLAKGCQ